MSLGLWAGGRVTQQPTQAQARQLTQAVCVDECPSSGLWGSSTVTHVDRSRGRGLEAVDWSILSL